MYKYQMSIELNVLKHLGINLYSNAVAVISEIIANSWDADATEVCINTSKTGEEPFLTIRDNGSGMDINDINEKFLCVGYQKREEQFCSEIFKRPFMGRKGIGKLSLFSIADEIEVHSCKNGEKNGFILDMDEINKVILEKKTEYYPREVNKEHIYIENGTLILLKRPRKNYKKLDERLKTKIARRFSIFSDDFKVFVDGEAVSFEDRDYFSKIDYMWHFSPEEERYYSKYSFEKEKYVHVDVPIIQKDLFAGKTTFPIKGWIGSVKETTSLKDGEESLNKITVIVRGKVAKEDILPEIKEDRLFKMYLIGEIHIDFFDDDEFEEMSISNRQDFNEEDPRYKDAIIHLTDVIKKEIAPNWNKWKEDKGTEKILNNGKIKEWYNSLKGDSKSIAKKLFSRIEKITAREDDKKELLKHGILAFERLRLSDTLSKMNSLIDVMSPEFQDVFSTIDDLEAVFYHDIVKGRVEVIRELEHKVETNEREKLIQKYLFEHLWLLDPSWERATDCPASMEKNVKNIFNEIDESLSEEEKAGRIDIQYKLSSGKNIIVELKRPERVVSVYDLAKQGEKYITAFKKMFKNCGKTNEIVEVICVLGKELQGWNDTEKRESDIDVLEKKKIKVFFYSELIENALKAYDSFLEKNKELSRIKDVIDSL